MEAKLLVIKTMKSFSEAILQAYLTSYIQSANDKMVRKAGLIYSSSMFLRGERISHRY